MTDDMLVEISRWQREAERRAVERRAQQQLGECFAELAASEPPDINRLTGINLLSV